ncbi:Mor transcription activator family protein [uncultured Shewanella sp.]|uniref:Mor transcription activator family protein n=1 Tax=uncultured Shewanella sp. TaxID=173975 RepID=UPI0026126AA1|nr:Mor transcription activator family protein [uncultured Shewanella sp.]
MTKKVKGCDLFPLDSDYPETVQTIIGMFKDRLKAEGVINENLADKLTLELSIVLGGRDVYIPKLSRLKTFIRNISIFDKFNGDNTKKLADEYDMTPNRIYQIVKEQQAIRKKVRENKRLEARQKEARQLLNSAFPP